MLAHCIFIRWLGSGGLIEISAVVVAEANVGYTAIVKCDCIARSESNRFIVILNRAVTCTLELIRNPTIDERSDEMWLQSDSLIVVVDCIIVISRCRVCISAIVECDSQPRSTLSAG